MEACHAARELLHGTNGGGPSVFDKLVPPDHCVSRVKQAVDFERCLDPVKDCYSLTMGRTAHDPVRLFKLEFLPFHDTLSDREVIDAAQVNVAALYLSHFHDFLVTLPKGATGLPSWTPCP
ncbi:hypothetical protein NKDENANG_03668 [Candidatus Entotheonellaceae bacterium PAL068K]